jgi:hypothetical protein
MRKMSERAMQEILSEFKTLFPAVAPVQFEIRLRPAVRCEVTGKRLYANFSTEVFRKHEIWNMTYTKAVVSISESKCKTRRDLGESLVHELLHAYYTKVGGVAPEAEEFMCTEVEPELYDLIQKRIRRRKKLRKLVSEGLRPSASKTIHLRAA